MSKFTVRSLSPQAQEEGGKADLLLSQIDALIQEQLALIAKTRRSLYSASILFKETDNILPVQCKRTIRLLEKLGKNSQQLCVWLNETAGLPPIHKVLRYRLTSVLYLIDERIYKTAGLINNFRDICMTGSPSVRPQRRKIYTALETLLSYVDDLAERAESLDYEAHRLQKQLECEEAPCSDDEDQDIPRNHKLRIVK